MNDAEILTAAARLRGKRSWTARVKKWGGKKAAARKMREIRRTAVRKRAA